MLSREKDQPEEQEAFLERPLDTLNATQNRKTSPSKKVLWHLRWLAELAMIITITALLAALVSRREPANKDTPVPDCGFIFSLP